MRPEDEAIKAIMLAKWRRRAARFGISVPERAWVDAHYAPQYWNGFVGLIKHDGFGTPSHVATYHYDRRNRHIFYSGFGAAYWGVKTAVEKMLEGYHDALLSQTRYPIERGAPLVRDQLHIFWRYAARLPLPRRMNGVRIHTHEHHNPYTGVAWPYSLDDLPPDPDMAISVGFPVTNVSRKAMMFGTLGNPATEPCIRLTYRPEWGTFSGRWMREFERGAYRKRVDEAVTQHDTAMLSAILPSIRILGNEVRVCDEDLVMMRLAATEEE